MELPSHPFCGALAKDDKLLCVGCEAQFLAIYSLEKDPLDPETVRIITL